MREWLRKALPYQRGENFRPNKASIHPLVVAGGPRKAKAVKAGLLALALAEDGDLKEAVEGAAAESDIFKNVQHGIEG